MIDYKIYSNFKKDITTVFIEGSLVIQNVVKIKSKLLEIINENKNLSINIINVADIDLSFLQLIEGITKSNGLQKQISIQLKNDLAELVNSSGFFKTGEVNFKNNDT